MVKAVLFDLDGVLIDSESISSKASDSILNEAGIFLSDEEKKEVFGRRTIDNYKNHVEKRGLSIDPSDLVKKKIKKFNELIVGNLKPLPGAVSLIKMLKQEGILIAVVSSSPLERVEASLNEVGLLVEFPLIISGDCCSRGKPDPEPFLLASERLSVDPSDCVVIEDAQAGILAAKSAGMKCISVLSPHTHGQDLSKSDKIVDSLNDVTWDLLQNL